MAFYNCSGLTSVNYTGTIEEWNAISKGSKTIEEWNVINKKGNWNYNVPATVVHCTDGDVDIKG